MKRPPKTGPFTLPVIQTLLSQSAAPESKLPEAVLPDLDAARVKLCGRYPSAEPEAEDDGGCAVGEEVWYRAKGPLAKLGPRPGVVLVREKDVRDVWLGDGKVVRVPPLRLDVRAANETADPWAPLASVAEAARRFASLLEGQVVTFGRAGSQCQGLLREKCRYGALVAPDPEVGAVLAVGFQSLR